MDDEVIKLSDYVFARVSAAGVKHVFMVAGGGCMHLVDSLGNSDDVSFVANLHEHGCAIAAEAYGQYTNELGVALVTTGPGGTNAITGVAGAWLDSTPCLFISGQVKRADSLQGRSLRQFGFQEVDIVRLVTPITKYAVTVDDPGTIGFHLDKALHLARSGRPGPVWIDIPLDVQAAMVHEESLEEYSPQPKPSSSPGSTLSAAVAETLRLFASADRPVVLVGNGVRLARAEEDLQAMLEALEVPVLTTWKALDLLPDDHGLYCGRPGSIGQRGANFTQQNADLILVIGARLDLGQTGYNHAWFARDARAVVVDVDAAEIAKLDRAVDVSVVADAGEFIREVLRQSAQRRPGRGSQWLARCKAWQARYPVVRPEYWAETDGVNTYVLVDVLSEALVSGDVLVPGSSGSASEVTMQAFRVKAGQRVFNTEGLGAMGFGVPAAIGGCIASGGRRTVCIDGDGSFAMNAQELEVARRLDLPVKFFILNNGGYESIRASQRNHFGGHFVGADPPSGLTLPDVSAIAAAYGIDAVLVESHDAIRERVVEVLERPGPVVCEVLVSPTMVTQPRLSSAAREDGTMVSRPLEDLWPFLDRDELRENMVLPLLDEES